MEIEKQGQTLLYLSLAYLQPGCLVFIIFVPLLFLGASFTEAQWGTFQQFCVEDFQFVKTQKCSGLGFFFFNVTLLEGVFGLSWEFLMKETSWT